VDGRGLRVRYLHGDHSVRDGAAGGVENLPNDHDGKALLRLGRVKRSLNEHGLVRGNKGRGLQA